MTPQPPNFSSPPETTSEETGDDSEALTPGSNRARNGKIARLHSPPRLGRGLGEVSIRFVIPRLLCPRPSISSSRVAQPSTLNTGAPTQSDPQILQPPNSGGSPMPSGLFNPNPY